MDEFRTLGLKGGFVGITRGHWILALEEAAHQNVPPSLTVSHVPQASNHKASNARFTSALEAGHTSYQSPNQAQGRPFSIPMAGAGFQASCQGKVSQIPLMTDAHQKQRPGWGWGVGGPDQHGGSSIAAVPASDQGDTKQPASPRLPSTYPQAAMWAHVRDKVVLAGGLEGAEH